MLIVHIVIFIAELVIGGLIIWFASKRILKEIDYEKLYLYNEEDDFQHANIIVDREFYPNTILFEPNRPIKLNFFRENVTKCSEEIIIPALKKKIKLTPFKDNCIELKFSKSGVYPFRCGKGVMNGNFVVEYHHYS